jgi:predicted nucleic acid-binding protein
MPFVVDASVAGGWLLPDEDNPVAMEIFTRFPDDTALAPDLLLHEVRNLLLMAERRGRIDPANVELALLNFRNLPLELHQAKDDLGIIRLARKHRLTPYDAAYFELAISRQLPLATLDKRLKEAARFEKVELFGDGSDIG